MSRNFSNTLMWIGFHSTKLLKFEESHPAVGIVQISLFSQLVPPI